MGGIRIQTLSLMTHLASHGFVVVAPDHTDDTIWDMLRDGYDGLSTNAPIAFVDRPEDIKAIGQFLLSYQHPLSEIISTNIWGVFGHSFGAITSILLSIDDSTREEKIKAAIPMAPLTRFLESFNMDHCNSYRVSNNLHNQRLW